MTLSNEKAIWDQTAEMHGNDSVVLGKHISRHILEDPANLVQLLARYKCSAKMGCKRGDILEVNCKSGFGAPILGEFAQSYLGIDPDEESITSAKWSLPLPKFSFSTTSLENLGLRQFDCIVSINDTPNKPPRFQLFLTSCFDRLKGNGVLVLSFLEELDAALKEMIDHHFHYVFPFTPNITLAFQASKIDFTYVAFGKKKS